MLKIRVSNPQANNASRYAYHVPAHYDYEGEIVPNPVWVKDDSFCL